MKLFHAQLSMKFIMLINAKMPKVVGIFTFISWITIASLHMCLIFKTTMSLRLLF